jgi:Chlorite dismutase
MQSRLSHFSAGTKGLWAIREVRSIKGETLPFAEKIHVGETEVLDANGWTLSGIRSNTRYTTSEEKAQLEMRQEDLGRSESGRAVMILIKKNAEWWLLSQDERRAIFEEKSKHTSIGLRFLPAIARRLFHCRDLGIPQPFDFITWFEFKAEDEAMFDDLLSQLRSSVEWEFIEREVDVRLEKA